MKNLIILILFISVFLVSCKKQIECTGKIKETYKEPTKHGYDYHVVFYCDTLKRNVDVCVSENTFANLNSGDTVSFNLSESETTY